MNQFMFLESICAEDGVEYGLCLHFTHIMCLCRYDVVCIIFHTECDKVINSSLFSHQNRFRAELLFSLLLKLNGVFLTH